MTQANNDLTMLHQILEDERTAIRAGAFDQLTHLITRKEALLVNASTLDAEYMAPLRERMEHNQRLIEAAISGLRVAGQRVDQIMAAARKCTTYDRNGQTQHMVNAEGALERRA